ncbi:hypothetical protein JXA05_04320, partial [Candidatus Peregrinibacteria bacterium]|nr:hypothetical protein [Candidatus Peregrinibacteria bacterium]
SMTVDFPVSIVWNDDKKITRLKVAYNEQCQVYNAGLYTDSVKITARFKSNNLLVADHEAELIRKNKKYHFDYATGCGELREFVGETAYGYFPQDKLGKGTLYLPGNRGTCKINSSTFVEDITPQVIANALPALDHFQYQAMNNSAYFYWDPLETGKKMLYLVSYSRYPVNPDELEWKQMPNLKYWQSNSGTVEKLGNGITYYFYIAALDEDQRLSPWATAEILPVNTMGGFKNNPDFEPFEVKLDNGEVSYTLIWDDKSDAARRWNIMFYVNGKKIFSKYIDGAITRFEIPKKTEYAGKRFRFTVRSLAREKFGPTFYDGIYWEEPFE